MLQKRIRVTIWLRQQFSRLRAFLPHIRWWPMPKQNPCMRCGACCAMFPITFDSRESDSFPGGMIPSRFVLKLNSTRSTMRGTEKRPIRCQALSGEIGYSVHCTIYSRRPKNCRDFLATGENNVVNSFCDFARAVYGLMPLSNFWSTFFSHRHSPSKKGAQRQVCRRDTDHCFDDWRTP